MLKKKAQSTLEYVIILTAIVAAVLAGVVIIVGNKTAGSATGLGKIYESATSRITDATSRLPGVGSATPGSGGTGGGG